MIENIVIAIDGPAGSGKSTVAKKLAERLGFVYVDTGAMYRSITWKALKNGIDLNSPTRLAELARTTEIILATGSDDKQVVLVDGQDVSLEIRSEDITRQVKAVADAPGVRGHLVSLQRRMRENASLVMEGRDITTVVFPNAEVKFYLNATAAERAKRRYEELIARGEKAELKQIAADIEKRDAADKNRPQGALRKSDDSIEIDTTGLTIDEVVEALYRKVEYRRSRVDG